MRSGSKLVAGALAGVVGFLVVGLALSRPADPGARLPQSYRLTDLIAREQASSAALQRQADQLRRQVGRQEAGVGDPGASVDAALNVASGLAGLGDVRGAGLRVTLDDSSSPRPEGVNVNDLVIHSQDVQAVVNGLWHAGAAAIAVNGERLVATSAVLCVGNTLLLDGTVHSPPYVVVAVGAARAAFDADALVRRLRRDADLVHLGFSVERASVLDVPGFPGPVNLRFATPLTAG
jgi:uncharacterized protein YlxW (UPF0749 family)